MSIKLFEKLIDGLKEIPDLSLAFEVCPTKSQDFYYGTKDGRF